MMDSRVMEFAAPKGRPSVAQGDNPGDEMRLAVFFSPEGATVIPKHSEITLCVCRPSGAQEHFLIVGPIPGLSLWATDGRPSRAKIKEHPGIHQEPKEFLFLACSSS
jgi:hypothetical protein